MALKNYTSESPLPNIFAAIERSLVTHGAKQITRDYDETGKVSSMSFVIETARGNLNIRLPARSDRIEAIFKKNNLGYTPGQPYRTAWATIRDWIAAQLALIEWSLVKPEEVFLPYAVNASGKTFFEMMEEKVFQALKTGV